MSRDAAHASAEIEVIVVGAGPAGLACAIEAERASLSCVVLDKGCVVNSLYHFPRNLVFFSSPERLELAEVPFATTARKPSRAATVEYYRRVTARFALTVRQYERVITIERDGGIFVVSTEHTGGRSILRGLNVVVATGFFDWPRRLGVPGEDRAKVTHRFDEGHPYYDRDVAVVGGRSAAAEAALELQRAGARVTLIHRGDSVETKYWIQPELENRIERGEIAWLPRTRIDLIEDTTIRVVQDGASRVLPNEAVVIQAGYRPDLGLLTGLGVRADGADRVPRHAPKTYQTEIPGLFVCGSVCAGDRAGSIFIETARFHGQKIVAAIAERRFGSAG